ncbi:MAG: hypothetical protein ACYCUY_03835 [Acidithiobacillus sp.]|jgi:hypothetical protein
MMLKTQLNEIDSACDQFKKTIDDVATLYLASESSASILAAIQLPDDFELQMHLSDDFPKEATTIRDTGDVLRLYRSGTYGRLNSYQVVISLCSVFEVWVKSVADKLRAPERKSISITSWRRENRPEVVKNQTLCLVRSIHDKYGIDSQLGADDTLCWIYNFFLIRNAIVHEGGMLRERTRSRLVAGWKKRPTDQYLVISGNDIDDMVHFIKLNVSSFAYKVHEKCAEPAI